MGLWWDWSRYTLPSGKTIGDVKSLIATNAQAGLPGLGYADIAIAADVHGKKGAVQAAVAYLQISGNDYWQVVNCAGSKTDLNELLNSLGVLHNDFF